MDVKDWKNVILNKILSIFKTNSTPGVKLKIGTVELIFHSFFKYLVILEAALWKTPVFHSYFQTYFQRTKVNILSIDLFSLLPGTRKKNVVRFSKHLPPIPWLAQFKNTWPPAGTSNN